MPLLGAGCRKESIMKNNYSTAERNRIVEEHLCCIDAVMRRNHALIRAARLEYDDVYQDLAICLILCVEQFDPEKGSLHRDICTQLQDELRNRAENRRLTDFTETPAVFCRSIRLPQWEVDPCGCAMV